MQSSHQLILLAGTLGVLSIFAGLISGRLGTPLLLVFLGLGMLAGRDGPVGIVFDDVKAAYFPNQHAGSVAAVTFIPLVARAATCFSCLSPFGFTLRETGLFAVGDLVDLFSGANSSYPSNTRIPLTPASAAY